MPDASTTRRSLTVVYNPLRVDDLDDAREVVAKVCAEGGWADPTWVETTAEETGEKQAREAVSAGADVVASLGGDGTVRAVGSALVGTNVALGLLPGGTGNLLARNLGVPVGALDEAVRAIVEGRDRRIDVGVVRLGDDLPEPESSRATKEGPAQVADDEEIFLVMTGLGLDGEIMADTDEKVKEAVGWVAYVLAAGKKLSGRGFPVEVRASGGGEGVVGAAGQSVARNARAVIVGNCGTLQGGVELMPEAVVDDGRLDAVVLAPRGAFGWASVLADVVTRNRAGHQRLDRIVAPDLTVLARRAVQAEIDGDPVGQHRALAIRVLPDSLVVRVG
ncbi:diacylglycerol kinase family protein [Terrabacter sp. MAHUQ-38]|uniref:diacylglycerol/lipid kinase family protein n=1 Tax=unclassified Terrabacter TaxID=2630222 RepID=UPI00165D9E1A|nr:diacylglycerol kinase family protein [Terrabacter sp. MAHUQ-38]MBC9820715.1 diacylglycerol kinase [Terrabacter sp. MAHUQ-38]